MLFGAGLPILFLEVCLGQYAGVGPIQIFGRMAPILKGLGYVNIFLLKLI
jgi:SNF family Na+-dependent transporter